VAGTLLSTGATGCGEYCEVHSRVSLGWVQLMALTGVGGG